MKNRKSFSIVWTILSLLVAGRIQAEEPNHIDIGRMDASRSLLDQYSFMAQPYSFRYFHNMDQLDLRLDWVRRAGPVFPLDEAENVFSADYIFRGERHGLDEYFEKNYTLGFLVLHENQIVFEKYFHDAGPKSRFLSNSMVKSLVSVLIGVAIDEGKINSVEDPAVLYLPYLSGSGFKDVTVKQLLQMATGIRWNEEYLDPSADFNRYMLAQLRGNPSFAELTASCESEGPPGRKFKYQSINTQVLGQLLEAATGMPLNQYCEEKLWRKIGADSDAFFYRSKEQPQIPAAIGFDATLRDYARFALMVMNGGLSGKDRVVPEAWIKESTTVKGASELPQSAGLNDDFSESLGYAYQWWLPGGDEGAFLAMGIYGQAIYIDPTRRVVIVQTSAWPEPDPDARWDEMIKVMTTIADKLNGSGSYTRRMWDENYSFYRKILNHPFNQELLSGELDEDLFKSYIIQDYQYLQNYRKVYGILLAKAPDDTAMKVVVGLINEIDEEIEQIHGAYIEKLNITREELTGSPPYPGTEFYNSFLVKTATLEPFEVGFMATLPCRWIYYQLGVDMHQSAKEKGGKYQEWIDGYWEAPWETSETKKVVDFIEKYMRATTGENRLKMEKAYVTAMKLEYMFWDGVYRGLKWVE